ncbi:rhomboid-related protein 2-like [Anthonomus grandis grandis]|uniref:rhomboid-related protein 2-like n=1 Tax=Anthonomus grandis grandis TaxID=2921223 RepID=UPI002165CB26|nr:rhomboid-related protein 2-like [Anthonomus grandis grandis]XP_050311410.1 rhomboid-related protein 2-like [Anthonomus grandis grandis]XP_050311416.1 rhomboid-related protein 2-like [Anthonomus grandis grandis]
MPENEQKLNHYMRIFNQVDKDQNNLICITELKYFLRSKGHTKDLPEDKIRYIFKLADKDGSKCVNFDEFVDLLEHPDFKHVFGQYVNNYVKFLVPQHKPKPHIVPRGRSIRIQSWKKEEEEETGFIQTDYASVAAAKYEEDISYGDEYTCCPPPFAMVLISVLELVFFLTDEISEKNSTLTGTGVTAKLFLYEPNKRHEAWRFLTYMFVHIGYIHIVVNLAFQLLLGIPLEMVHKWWRVSLLYFLGVIAGSLATSVADPWVRLAGASGGVYSLLTAHIATIVMNWSEMTLPLVQLFVLGIIIVFDLGSSIYDRYYLKMDDAIGYAAHFGGAIAGLLVGIYLLKNLNVTKFEKYLWWAAVVTYVVLTVIAIFMNIFLPGRYPPSS